MSTLIITMSMPAIEVEVGMDMSIVMLPVMLMDMEAIDVTDDEFEAGMQSSVSLTIGLQIALHSVGMLELETVISICAVADDSSAKVLEIARNDECIAEKR